MKEKKELIRVVRNNEGQIFVDPTGKKNGRGAYFCNNIACLESAIKSKRLEKVFGDVVGPEIYDMLRKQMEENNEL